MSSVTLTGSIGISQLAADYAGIHNLGPHILAFGALSRNTAKNRSRGEKPIYPSIPIFLVRAARRNEKDAVTLSCSGERKKATPRFFRALTH
jgi:hypothetical protein